MTRRSIAWCCLLIMAAAWGLMGGIPAFSQATNTGTVIGQVTDPSGAVIPGAKIVLENTSGTVRLAATSNDGGNFALTTVPPGTYNITVTKSGFATTKSTGEIVNVGTQLTVNFKLSVGSTSQTVEVQALGTELQTLNSTVGSTIAPEAVDSLPSLGHDVTTFMELQPGVSPDGSVAGAVSDQSTFVLDGGNNTSDMDGNNTTYNTTATFAGDPTGGVSANTSSGDLTAPPSGIMPTPADSIEEVKVNTANQTADFDNSSGAQVEFVTRRGTNRWHGSVYEYYLDNGLDANTWDNNDTKTPLTKYHYSRFGARAGGFLTPKSLGQRWYFFGFYEGYRFPQSQTIERIVPSANLKNGIVTEGGTAYNMKTVDPRGIGISPAVAAMWNKYEPAGNAPCGSLSGGKCDGVNELGFKANMSTPQKSNALAFRLDHDFSTKWHWFVSYRYFKLTQAVTSQYDIGGFFKGDTKGTPSSTANRPLQPSYLVTGLTTNITSTTTNDFHYSYLRNFWSWSTQNGPPQLPGLGGAMEPFGESNGSVLAPYNVNTQNIRTRFWDGQDHFFSDNVTMLKGNHLLQFGGQYQRNFDYHQRSDNGGGINFTPTYQLGLSSGPGRIDMTGLGGGYPGSDVNAARLAEAVLGIVAASQVTYTRSGKNLALNPPLTHAFDKSTIPYYNAYISDTWHIKPSVSLTYGMGYTLEMPPSEQNGKQTVLVDSADAPVSTVDYIAQRKAAALNGQVYNPLLGWSLVGNVGNGLKYPYQPFYGSFSPRVAFAWNPSFSKSTVVRGGYGRIYGRLNGVDLVLVPLLGVGLMQAVQCTQPFMNGTCGTTNPTAANAFRIGVDGSTAPLPAAKQTLPQPDVPGVNDIEAAAPSGMDPHFRPNVIDSFDFSIQRQIGQKSLLEIGYIGRVINHEYLPINLNAVPYMTVAGGQQFQTAYANLEKALGCDKSEAQCGANVPASITPQPFFEAALAGSGYCNGYASCTAAVLDKEMDNLTGQMVWSLWSDLDNGKFNFPRSMMNNTKQASSGMDLNASIGYGNYHAMFITFGTRNWHGLTMQNNFTWSKALGTGAVVQASSEITANDPYNIRAMYGYQPFDRRVVYNGYLVASEPWFKGQSGLLGRVAGGWTLSPIFTAGSGAPVFCGTSSQAQAWGAADGNNYFENEQCVFTSPYKGGHSAHFGVTGDSKLGIGDNTSTTPVNMFKDPVAVWNQVRPPILGIDTTNSGVGPIPGLPYWNVDAQLKKQLKIAESVNFEFSFIAANVFNHREFVDPTLNLSSSDAWGVLNTQNGNPRQMEFGARVSF